jgi:hypothetical protein
MLCCSHVKFEAGDPCLTGVASKVGSPEVDVSGKTYGTAKGRPHEATSASDCLSDLYCFGIVVVLFPRARS